MKTRYKIMLIVFLVLGTIVSIPSMILNGSYNREENRILDEIKGTCYPIAIVRTPLETIKKFEIQEGDYLQIDCDLKFKVVSESDKLSFLEGEIDLDLRSNYYIWNYKNQEDYQGGFSDLPFIFNGQKYSIMLDNTSNYQRKECLECIKGFNLLN